MTVHKSPLNLKERVANSRTYVKPLQCDLDLTPLDSNDDDYDVVMHYLVVCVMLMFVHVAHRMLPKVWRSILIRRP